MAVTGLDRFSVSGNVIERNWFYDLGGQIALPDFWPELGYDGNAIAGTDDPQFRDPARNDYTVQNQAAADRIGFRNFSMNRFGQPDCRDICPAFQKRRSDGCEDILQRETWLGAVITAVNDTIMTATAAGSLEGVYVEGVADDAVAAAYGLRAGDVIREINGVRIVGKAELRPLYEAVGDGENIRLTVIRNSKGIELSFAKVLLRGN